MKPKLRKGWEIADTITAATVALLVVVFAIFGFLVWQAFGTVATQASDRAERAADMLSARTHIVIGSVLALLDIVGRAEGIPDAVSADDFTNLTDAISRFCRRATAKRRSGCSIGAVATP